MAQIETYGGCCPKCLRGMVQLWTSYWPSYMYDACPGCGFIYIGEGVETPEEDAIEAWERILELHEVKNQKELPGKYKETFYTLKENKEFFPSIYNYSEDEGTLLMYKLLWREMTEEGFTVGGVRVRKNEQKGTIMEYKEGNVYILWDGDKETVTQKLCKYDGKDIGTVISLI